MKAILAVGAATFLFRFLSHFGQMDVFGRKILMKKFNFLAKSATFLGISYVFVTFLKGKT